jgi:hypothetical protein
VKDNPKDDRQPSATPILPPIGVYALLPDKFWLDADSLLPGQAFPDRAKASAEDCVIRLSTVFFSSKRIAETVCSDRDDFFRKLSEPIWDGGTLVAFPTQMGNVVEYHYFSTAFDHAANSFFYGLKAFWDRLSPTITLVFSEKPSVHCFHKGYVRGCRCSGANLINWLLGYRGDGHNIAAKIGKTLLTHSTSWLGSAIELRDYFAHGSQGAVKARLARPMYVAAYPYIEASKACIQDPILPNSQDAVACVNSLEKELRALIGDLVDLIREATQSIEYPPYSPKGPQFDRMIIVPSDGQEQAARE